MSVPPDFGTGLLRAGAGKTKSRLPS